MCAQIRQHPKRHLTRHRDDAGDESNHPRRTPNVIHFNISIVAILGDVDTTRRNTDSSKVEVQPTHPFVITTSRGLGREEFRRREDKELSGLQAWDYQVECETNLASDMRLPPGREAEDPKEEASGGGVRR